MDKRNQKTMSDYVRFVPELFCHRVYKNLKQSDIKKKEIASLVWVTNTDEVQENFY